MVKRFLQNHNIDITYTNLPVHYAGMCVSLKNKKIIVVNESIIDESKDYYAIALSYFCVVKNEPNKILLNTSTKEQLEALSFANNFFKQED